ncbi:hypothetical protein [Neobacillus sp. PS3-40]|uniref:hypothetical protein n=1 Tax=Neobacillus sp. PS3-40 TaxID=3070679 RepID=UPI0027DF836D|nr:hypothetical protein [Neobacillus sp. PS3-40]WML44069.1 hypothetical protein RCG20_20180 [Neobacillus sp. PS3-40]
MSRKNGFVPLEKRINEIAKTLDIQGSDPSTEYDQYMRGLYNGLELALASLEMREPVFKVKIKNSWIKKRLNKWKK